MLDTFKHKGQRARLVEDLIRKGITDEAVLEAMRQVPRHLFVEGAFADEAYLDKPLPIQSGQTISQPFTVAYQTQLLRLKPKMKVLEIGTGSGYQAAILAAMGMRVFSVEVERRLHLEARTRFGELGFEVRQHLGDGSQGWSLYAPYDRILVTAASPAAPQALREQLVLGGRLVLPVGNRDVQRMTVVTRLARLEFETEILQEFRFVPLRGKFGFADPA
ncbi:MAG: protein-L-isoaspartate(D-aspartate) O-methyltransferase [Bacteroidia bacterium]|nr:protein-L-isoaspartate(D-aspartate) O-methyltransferase [Bacteroidia bacterium]